MSLPDRIRGFTQNDFIRNVGVLAGGTVMGQLVLFAVLPVLTRLYDPSAFGLLGIYTSVTIILSVVACLRLEIATPLPKEDREAVNLVVLGLMSASVIAVCLALAALVFPNQITHWLRQPDFRPYVWMIPMGVWLAAVYSAIQFWSIRKKRYGMVAKTQFMRAIGGSSTQIGLGYLGNVPFGLLFGHMIYTGLGSFGLARLFWKHDRSLLANVSKNSLREALSKYRKFPLFSVPEALLNSAAANLPVILVGALSSVSEAGFLLLAQRVISIPVGLLGSSLSRVYLSHSREEMEIGALGAFTRQIMKTLAKIGILPFGALALGAPFLFPFVFGEEWARAGQMISWLMPAMFLQFIVSPVSTILHATNNQLTALVLQIFGFVLIIGSILVVGYLFVSYLFIAFALSSTVYYLAYLSIVLYISHQQDTKS